MVRELFGVCGNIAAWSAVTVSYIQQIKDVVQLIASIVAVVMSIMTARYYYLKTKKLKG